MQGILNTGPLAAGDYAFVIEGFVSAHGRYAVSMGCESNHREYSVRGNLDCGQEVTGHLMRSDSHLFNFTVGVNMETNVVLSSCRSSFDTCE